MKSIKFMCLGIAAVMVVGFGIVAVLGRKNCQCNEPEECELEDELEGIDG